MAFWRDERGMEVAQAVLLLIGGVILVSALVRQLSTRINERLTDTINALSNP